ncbi:hypothetical protein DEIPH_ctg011orf0053 [Deinococcus phoenicis]|uniref:Uncharacterized protein n=1 Tax=Deinococcus phoenicis TaxID=1476583 RepID=A0A016QSL9_9DEIO|nr:hypothetical protein [Deinococcus phoenicis]EYB69085.1 hypothetical protein DEIPH_ctg011orf0053 [Deinococcus phoenicis]
MTELEFTAYWELLCERHKQTPSAPLTRLYALTIRGAGLTADEWAQAIAASVRFDDFFPSVQKLIDYARPSFKAQALSEWDAAVDRATRGEAATLPGTYTRTLMNRVTNGKPLGEVDADRLPWLKREFLERYAEHLTQQAQAATPVLTAGPRRQALPDAS